MYYNVLFDAQTFENIIKLLLAIFSTFLFYKNSICKRHAAAVEIAGVVG